MSINSIIETWEQQSAEPSNSPSNKPTASPHLPIELTAKLAALQEIYPGHTQSQLASDLIAHALKQCLPDAITQH